MADMYLKSTTMYHQNLQLVRNPVKVLLRYIVRSFLIDLFANTPFYLINEHLIWL